MKQREATHWVMVPVSREQRELGRSAPTGDLYAQAIKGFKALDQGEVVGAPWFHRWQDSPLIMPDGRVVLGPAAIFFARLEKTDVQETASGSAT